MSILSGDCNRCGLCCTAEVDGHIYVCQYLRAERDAALKTKPLGAAGATRCGAYETRRDGMPIVLRNLAGQTIHTTCSKGTWAEDKTIIARGIGRGCSLTVDKTRVPAATELEWDVEHLDEIDWLRRHGYDTPAPKLIVTHNEPVFIRTGEA